MPIYAYKCTTCGHEQDVLQKISDSPLTLCPSCNAATFSKQVTAAGFQLKGSGWYVTDFRDGAKKKEGTTERTPNTKADAPDSPATAAPAAAATPSPAPSPTSAPTSTPTSAPPPASPSASES